MIAYVLTRAARVGQLAEAAVADRVLPEAGRRRPVRQPLRAVMADGDMFEALDNAESAWLAS